MASPKARYRELAQKALEVAGTFAPGKQRDALLQMAQVWQRLAFQYGEATPPFSLPVAEQPAMQQQQQIQPDDDKKE